MRKGTLSAALAFSVLVASSAWADVESAKKYVDEAKSQLESNSPDDAKTKLELAETELDGVADADKAPVVAQIAALRKQMSDGALAVNKIKYKRELDNGMTDAEGSIGNQATWLGAENRMNELFANADAKAALGDDLVAAQKKFATYKKLNDKKVGAIYADQADAAIKELEDLWTADKPKITKPETPGDKDTAVDEVDRKLQDVRQTVAKLPADSDKFKTLNGKIDAIGTEFTQLALADKVKEKATRLQEDWDSYKDEYAGWDKEVAGPTFADYSHNSGDTMDAYNSPKSRGLISRSSSWIKNRETDDDYQKLQSAPEIKAIYSKITVDRATALAKMEKFADAMLKEAEAIPQPDPNQLDAVKRFEDNLKNNLEGSDKLEAYDKRALAIVAKAEGKANANVAAADAFYKDATAKAAADWPAMKTKYSTTEGFDPNAAGDFKGKSIVILTDNLMGYRFSPGDFPFATTINGIPVAGKFDPAVAAAVKDVQTKMGRSLGDSDDDGKWEVIAVVDGTMGKLTKRVNVEGKVKDDMGNEATVTGEKHETVDAPIITIVAAHCGPLAVSAK